MPRGQVTSPEVALAVHRMALDGLHPQKIAQYFGADNSRFTARILKNYSAVTGYPFDNNKRGRPRATSEADDQELRKLSDGLLKENPKLAAMQMARNIESLGVISANRRAIYRRLREFEEERKAAKIYKKKIAQIPAPLPVDDAIPVEDGSQPEFTAQQKWRLSSVVKKSGLTMPAELPVEATPLSADSLAETERVIENANEPHLETGDLLEEPGQEDEGIVAPAHDAAQPLYYLLIPNPEPGTGLGNLSQSGLQSVQKQILFQLHGAISPGGAV